MAEALTAKLSRQTILDWLREEDEERVAELWRLADETRQRYVGDEVHLRGLLEISNHCVRQCAYCGLRAPHRELERYRMTAEEISACAYDVAAHGFGTIVMQAGEDPGISGEWLASVIRQIKAETALAVTLSMGERTREELALWRDAGADRYLLRFETSDPVLLAAIHPRRDGSPGDVRDRLLILEQLRELGYEVGSGVMIGIPGQSYESLAADIALYGELDLDMVGEGPYVPHPATPLEQGLLPNTLAAAQQVPNSELMCYKVVALTRLVCPEANIPATTALATLYEERGRELGLTRGANVIMPNVTPVRYRELYQIYPDKACLRETVEECQRYLAERLSALGRRVGVGRGDRRRRAVAKALPINRASASK